jgi:hypothetical protein
MWKFMKMRKIINLYLPLALFVFVLGFAACKKEKDMPKTLAELNLAAPVIVADSAFFTAEVTKDGNNPVSKRGIVWNYSPNPTIDNNATLDGSGTGKFIRSIGFFDPGTIYVRAYAENEIGIAYSNEVSFTTAGITTAPSTYTQKAVLEYTTCAGCTFCPDGEVVAENMVNKYGDNRLFPVAMHNLYQGPDSMATTESKVFSTTYNQGNPSGFVNRITAKCESRTAWEGQAETVLLQDAKCGLAIDASKVNGTVYSIKVRTGVGAKALPAGNYYVIAYIVDKEMSGKGSGWDQTNYYNSVPGHKYYQKGNPAKGFLHANVFVKSLKTMNGILITQEKMAPKAIGEFDFTLDMKGKNTSDIDVIAMIYFKKTGGSYVENVQRVKLGESKVFD